MSKAFTRESDDVPDPPPTARPFSVPGGKNYLTPAGAQRLQAELERLIQTPPAATASEESKREQQLTQQRISYLQQSLAAAIVVPPPAPPWEQVVFGATVALHDRAGETTQYRIVGVDETDLDRNWISWLSPIARALQKARVGQQIKFRTPAGEQQWEIIGINYE
jgi:transcription elongation factor GreB